MKRWFCWLQQGNLDACPYRLMGICWVHYGDWVFKFIYLNYVLRKIPKMSRMQQDYDFFFPFAPKPGEILPDLKNSWAGYEVENVLERVDDGEWHMFPALSWELHSQRCIHAVFRRCVLFMPSTMCHPVLCTGGFSVMGQCCPAEWLCQKLCQLELCGVYGDGAQMLPSPQPQQHPGTPPKGTQLPPHADDNPKPSCYLIPSSTSCPWSLLQLPINISCKVEMGSYFNASSSQVTKYWAATHF